MPAIGEPSAPLAWQEKLGSYGATASVAYCPPALGKPDQPDGARADGRKNEETRPCHLRTQAVPNAAGSAYVEQGRTKIVAAVYGPRQAEVKHQAQSEGYINVNLTFTSFCSRATTREENDKRALFYNSVLQGSLASVVLLERYAKTAIEVNIVVLEDDGAALTVALAAASLALADAAIEMRDIAAGATVHLRAGDASGTLLLDCDGQEEHSMPEGSAVLHLGLCPSRGVLCLIHSAGPLPPGLFEQMVLLAKDTSDAMAAEIRRCLENRVERRAAKRLKLIGGQVA
jgi:exosome complex component RRP41